LSLFNELKRRNVFKVAIAYVVVAWLVLQVADVVLNNITAPTWVFQVLMLFLAIGFPFAVIFAWAFEMTPEGLKRESEVDRSQSITPQTGKKLNATITVVMALALGYFAYDKFVLSASREAALVESTTQAVSKQATSEEVSAESDNSIAVLPFVNMSDDASNEFFSDGISEEMLNLLAKIPELRVIARTSSFAYKGKDIQIADVARELNVEHVLEGSVRKAGNQVRITAQLIRADDSSHLWSETYDRSLDNIFAIQDEIAAAVVAQLKVTLLGTAPTVQEVNPEAFSLYLQARHLGRLGNVENDRQSEELFNQALAIDPEYAAAWEGLAGIYSKQAGQGLLPFEEGYRLSREMAQKALAIDPNYALAHARLGWIANSNDNDLAAAAKHYERALELDPLNLDVIGSASALLQSLGRLDEAIALQEYEIARDPVRAAAYGGLGISYNSAQRFDEAITAFRTSLRLNPDRNGPHYAIGLALMSKGQFAEALEELALEPREIWVLLGSVMAHHSLGQHAESDAVLQELIDKHEREWAYNIAYVSAWRGEMALAFSWLDKAVEYRDPGLSEIASELLFVNLYDDPRWLPFLESIGKSPEQLAAIEFKVTLP